MKDLTDFERLVLSFLVAFSGPLLIAFVLGAIVGSSIFTIVLGLALCAYTLVAGFQKNGEMEQSIGGIFNQMTPWIIPKGVSWWVPKPFGQALRKMSVDTKTIDRSVKGGQPFTKVKTRDNGTVTVGVVMGYRITDAYKVAQFDPEDHKKQVESFLDRAVRLFALYFDSDEDQSEEPDSALSNKKREMSVYISGNKTFLSEEGEKPLMGLTADGKGTRKIESDIAERAELLGIAIDVVDVTDVNEPEEVQLARNQAAAQRGQGDSERLDMRSVRHRVLELMWGEPPRAKAGENEQTIEEWAGSQESQGKKPLMTYQEALNTVRAARKDIEVIDVQGGGDFAKGAAIQRGNERRKK